MSSLNEQYIGRIIRSVINEEIEDRNHQDMTVTTEWMKDTYNRFNQLYWGGSLPSDLYFKLNGRLKSTFAKAVFERSEAIFQGDGTYLCKLKRPAGIEFSTVNSGEAWVFENTMLHEMIHIADYTFHPEHFDLKWTPKGRKWFSPTRYDAHGQVFFLKEAQRLSQYGWDIQKILTSEEMGALRYNKDYLEKQYKKQEAKKRKYQRAYNEYKQIRYTIDKTQEKAEIIQKLISRYTDNFTVPMEYREVNIGDLKIVLDYKEDIFYPRMDVEKPDSTKYKAKFTFNNKYFQTHDLTKADFSALFEYDYHRMWDIEDEFGIYI